jgi:hypothetical protein
VTAERRGVAMRKLRLAMFILPALLLLAPAPARAADLVNCAGTATSTRADGSSLDSVSAPGPGGTQDQPFQVDFDGAINVSGSSAAVLKNHSWRVNVWFIPVKTGSDPNEGGDQAITDKTVTVKDYIRFELPGLYYVSGSITGEGAACSGSGWVKVLGNPTGSIPWAGGVVLTGVGLVVVVLARPRPL